MLTSCLQWAYFLSALGRCSRKSSFDSSSFNLLILRHACDHQSRKKHRQKCRSTQSRTHTRPYIHTYTRKHSHTNAHSHTHTPHASHSLPFSYSSLLPPPLSFLLFLTLSNTISVYSKISRLRRSSRRVVSNSKSQLTVFSQSLYLSFDSGK